MKKIFIFLSVAVFMLVLATSCSDSKDGNKVTLTVESELGQLSKYLSVKDKDVTVTLSEKTKKKDDSKEETYKIIAASLAVSVDKAVASDQSFSLSGEVLDENHIKISNLPSFSIDPTYDYDNGDLNYTLQAGNMRAQLEEGTKDWAEEDQKVWDEICTKGKYLVIKPTWDGAKYAPYEKGSSDNSSVETSSSDEEVADGDFDEYLDAYEEFYNEYTDLLKRAGEGDADAISEYPEILKKAQELGEKMQKVQGNATPEQIARFAEIQKKFLNSAKNN
jgi:hypothetical protein